MIGLIAKKKLGIKVKHNIPMIFLGRKLEGLIVSLNCTRSNPIITMGEVHLILENECLKRVSASKGKHEINKVKIGTQICNPIIGSVKGLIEIAHKKNPMAETADFVMKQG